MEINLSRETIATVYNSLRCSKATLEQQANTAPAKKRKIVEHQLEEVEDALAVFEELMESIYEGFVK